MQAEQHQLQQGLNKRPIGLPNPSGWQTCYLNSVLQAFLSSHRMAQFVSHTASLHEEQARRGRIRFQPAPPQHTGSASNKAHQSDDPPLVTLAVTAGLQLFHAVRKLASDAGPLAACSSAPLATHTISHRAARYHQCIAGTTLGNSVAPAHGTASVAAAQQAPLDACATGTGREPGCSLGQRSALPTAPLVVALNSLLQCMQLSPKLGIGGHGEHFWQGAATQECVPASAVRSVVQGMASHTHGGGLQLGEQQDALEALQAMCTGMEEEATALAVCSHTGLLGLLVRPDALVLPCQGMLSHSLTCQECGNSSLTNLTPFCSLSLRLPARVDRTSGLHRVMPAASLLSCLQEFVQPNLISGVECSRCTLKAALLAVQRHTRIMSPRPGAHQAPYLPMAFLPPMTDPAAGAMPSAASPPGAPSCVAGQLARQLASSGPLPDVDLDALMSEMSSGLLPHGFRVRTSAVQRTLAPRLPSVLCLHLQRSVWDAHGMSKVHGHVAFPPSLSEHQLRAILCGGHPTPSMDRTADQAAGSQHSASPEMVSPAKAQWHLVSVCVHVGGGASAGHYVVFCRRRLGVGAECHYADSANTQAQSSRLETSVSDTAAVSWWCVSDSSVREATEAEVLACQAAILVYER